MGGNREKVPHHRDETQPATEEERTVECHPFIFFISFQSVVVAVAVAVVATRNHLGGRTKKDLSKKRGRKGRLRQHMVYFHSLCVYVCERETIASLLCFMNGHTFYNQKIISNLETLN